MIVTIRSLYVFIYTCWGNVLQVDNVLVICVSAHGAHLILNSLGWVNGNVSSRFNLFVDKSLKIVKLNPVPDHEELKAEGLAPSKVGLSGPHRGGFHMLSEDNISHTCLDLMPSIRCF